MRLFKKVDSAVHQINRYSVENAISFCNIILLDWRVIYSVNSTYSTFEQLGLVHSHSCENDFNVHIGKKNGTRFEK